MTRSDAIKRIKTLKKEIQHHRYLYHVLDKQEISDAALDSLKKELFDLEQQYPDLVTPDSPTQRVGGEPLEKFQKVTHQERMLSLNDAFDRADMDAWVERLLRLDPDASLTYFAETKMDGLAISLVYKDGVLKVGATRGNGRVGEDVTNNIRTIESIPLQLHDNALSKQSKRIEVRGEVYMSKEVFEKINVEREKNGEAVYANPRNTAAGSIRQLDPSIAAARDLRFMAYALMTDLGQQTHAQEHKMLQKLGFKTDPQATACTSIDHVMKFYDKVNAKRDALAYQIDGVVVQVDSNKQFQRLGVVGKAPRAAIALKFPAEQATTVVEDIQVQVGRTGALTPVAHLQPVQIAGTTVQRATLHNMDEIKRLSVKVGDTVVIEKAGDIIPDIVQVLEKMRSGKEKAFRMPRTCPVCGSPVTRPEGEVAHYCTNKECFAQQKEQFYHFISKKGLNVDGLGPKIVDQLLDEGLLSTPADLFELQEGDLEPLERFAETAAKNVIQAIKDARSVPLARFIYALGIRHVGEQTAIDLAQHFGSFAKLQQATQEELEAMHDIGPAAAESIVQYFSNNKHQQYIEQLLSHLRIENPQQPRSKKLQGKAFLFTGTLESMTRDRAKEVVRENGGTVLSSVSSKLDYLVAGENPGSKVEKAEDKDVQVITENEFFSLITNA